MMSANLAPTDILLLRITYPGQGEMVLWTRIDFKWAFRSTDFGPGSMGDGVVSPPQFASDVPMKLTINGRETFTLDEESRARGSVRLRGLTTGEYSMTLSAADGQGKGAHAEVSFIVVDAPTGLGDSGTLKGEKQVLRALPSHVLLQRLGDRRIPAVRRQMIERILEDRQ